MLNTFDKWATILIGSAVIIAVSVVLYATPTNTSFVNYAMASTVKIKMSSGHGSGVVISDDGLILTNDHVCGNQKEGFTVIRPDGKQVGAVALWTTGDEYDLCLIKSEDHATSEYYGQPGIKLDWHPATFATAEPTYGDEVTAIGNPFELEFVVTRGIVSSANQTVPYAKTKRLQFDAVVGPGNSGGGLWNDKYELIGIVHAGRAVRGVPVGLNFAIPISMVREVLAQ